MTRHYIKGRAGATDGYCGRKLPVEQPHLPHFGVLIATCERGDIRFTPVGATVYGLDGARDIKIPAAKTAPATAAASAPSRSRTCRISDS